jgi:tetratricopeptide (TPR) repeat protein
MVMKRLKSLLLSRVLLLCLVEGFSANVCGLAQPLVQTMLGLPSALLPMQGGSQAPAGSGADPATLFHQGKEAMQSGQFALAEDRFRQVIALDPNSAAPYINLGVTYMREKRWDDALVPLHKAELLAPNEAGVPLNIGLAYYRKNDFSAATEPFAVSLRLAPNSLQARYLLGLCYFFTNRYRDAAETMSPLWDKEATNLNYLYVLSIAASKSSNLVLQKKAFEQMLAVGKDSPEFHLYVGKAWLAEDDTGKALSEFQAAAAARPNLPLVHYFLGRTYLEQRALPQAEEELTKDVALEPDFAYNYEDLGILYAQQHQAQKAEHFFQLAIKRDSTLVNSYVGLAKLYRDLNRYQDALDMLDKAEVLAPQSASVHYTRAQVLARLGRSAEARIEFDAAAKLLKSFNDRLQQDLSDDRVADAQDAAQQ